MQNIGWIIIWQIAKKNHQNHNIKNLVKVSQLYGITSVCVHLCVLTPLDLTKSLLAQAGMWCQAPYR